MKINRYIIIGVLLLLGFQMKVQAQQMRKVGAKQSAIMIAQISKVAQSLKTVNCNFTQQSKVSYLEDVAVSKGYMNYNHKGKLLWQYVSPFKYTFSVDNGMATLKQGSHTNKIDLKSSKTYQSIAGMIESSITGKNLKNNRDFAVTMYVQGNRWIAFLQPRKVQFRKMMKNVRLYFNKNRKMVEQVEMNQANGDRITIMLSNVQITK